MEFFRRTETITPAYGILYRPGSVIYAVNKQLIMEKPDYPRESGLIHRFQFLFQIGKTERRFKIQHGLQHQQPDRRWFDFPCYKSFFK